MLVWRRSLIWSHRYKMFSVVVSWTYNKDLTSDKGIWLFRTEWEAQCSERGCPSLTEPFSTLGTDIKAASPPLKYSHMHRHKDRHAHTHVCIPAHLPPPTHTHNAGSMPVTDTQGREAAKNNFLSTGIRKTTVERGSAWERGRECVRQRHSVRQNSSDCRGKICKGDTTIWALSLSSWTQDRGDRLAASELKASETIFHINADTGRLLRFKHVWDTGTHSSLWAWQRCKHKTQNKLHSANEQPLWNRGV